jgi:3-hydroxybutyryl-CoA dehydratase
MFHTNDSFSHTYAVSESVYNKFIELFNDKNPLHTNEEFARSKKFNGRVMHGNILNGFLSHFIGECLPDKNVIIHSQQIQFKKPVYLDDTLTLNATVSGVFESVNAVEFKFNFLNGSEAVVAQGKIQIGII